LSHRSSSTQVPFIHIGLAFGRLGLISVDREQKNWKVGIYSITAWRSAFKGECGDQAGKIACCVLEQGT